MRRKCIGRVAEIYYYISMLFWTRQANLRRVENYIYDPSARINKNPLILQHTVRVDLAPNSTRRRVKFYIEL